MPHDPQLLADTRAWLLKAKNDLRGADIDLEAQPPLMSDAVFHCQQAVEKAFKGFLTWHDVPFRKTHDLGELGQQCLAKDASLTQLCQQAERLTIFAWMFRYPGEPEEPTQEEAHAALNLSRSVFQAIEERLPPEARS
ncbi:MAG: HEPN domain-containing protein [Planctomycetes bacterium]|nr:HEPN domain-containing protein [Planctomycetota bacterium]